VVLCIKPAVVFTAEASKGAQFDHGDFSLSAPVGSPSVTRI
jgi:hypothetical protein